MLLNSSRRPYRLLLLCSRRCIVVTVILVFSLIFLINHHHRSAKCPKKLVMFKLHSSHCSDRATKDGGRGQKVISFSLFQGKAMAERFIAGILANYKKMKEFYPGWVMRIYTDVNTSDLVEFLNIPDLYLCDTRNLPNLGDVSQIEKTVWRFLPIGDPTVDIFVSRDLDSLIGQRERTTVAQWENSNSTSAVFHSMRDNPFHIQIIMAGMWGAKNYMLTQTTRLSIINQFLMVISHISS